ncbi:MAG TPA: hypothetical protein VJ822_03120 [Dongiaceae bacterium]|nr:hypothetical protein [Dongiaceae bacterium]
MEGINPTLAFAALFLGLSGHPRDAVESPPDQTITTWPDDTQSRSGQTMLNFGIGYEDQITRPVPWWEWHVWGPFRCPEVAEGAAVEDGPSGSDVELGIEDSRYTVLDVVAKPVSLQGCG